MKIKREKFAKIFLTFILLLTISIAHAISNKDNKISLRLLNLISQRGDQSEFTAWIYFKDKGPNLHQKMEAVRMSLNPRALQRRLRHQRFDHLIDKYDVPVSKSYVEKTRIYVSRIRHVSRWLNAVSVEARGYDLKEIAQFPFVIRIDKVRTYTFREPVIDRITQTVKSFQIPGEHTFDYGPSFSQLEQLNVPILHDMGYSGNGVLICMLDSGFNNLTHEALNHLDIVTTWDFVNNDPNVFDEFDQMGNGNHGTNTLGTIAGYKPGQLIGPAYGASFLLGKTENTAWERHIEEDHWIAGAEWADDLGADIISSSLGYRYCFTHGERDYTWEEMDGKTANVTQGANIAASKGILVVNSAGNEGAALPPENTLIAPADSSQVIAVGAVDSVGAKVSFSSMGPTADGRIKPDIMAKGVEVYTSDTQGMDDYDFVNGTSFSCPLVAGVAALILEINPSWTNMNIMDALKLTANNSTIPNNRVGWGIVDAFKATFYNLKNIFPPSNFSVKRIENNYVFFVQYVDRLSWTSNPRNMSQVKYYHIYARRLSAQNQTFELIAELNNQTFSFERRGLLSDETFLYKITSANEAGEESDPDFARE